MSTILRALCGAVLLTSLVTAPAMAVVWRSDLVCDLNGDGFSDLGRQRPYAVIQGRGELYVSTIYGLPPARAFTCAIDCFPVGATQIAPCGTTDANGTLRAQRMPGFLPPEVCAGISFFLFDGDTPSNSDTICVDGVVIPE